MLKSSTATEHQLKQQTAKYGLTEYLSAAHLKSQKNRKLPVKAIVLLEKAPSDSICRLQTLNAFFEVLGKLTYENKDVEQAEIAIDTAKYLSENVPVFKLSCLPAESAVETLEEVLCQI